MKTCQQPANCSCNRAGDWTKKDAGQRQDKLLTAKGAPADQRDGGQNRGNCIYSCPNRKVRYWYAGDRSSPAARNLSSHICLPFKMHATCSVSKNK